MIQLARAVLAWRQPQVVGQRIGGAKAVHGPEFQDQADRRVPAHARLRTQRLDQRSVLGAVRQFVQFGVQALGLLVGHRAQLLVDLYAQSYRLGQGLPAQPGAVHLPARGRQRAQPALFLQQTADADLRSLALLEALRVRAPELSL